MALNPGKNILTNNFFKILNEEHTKLYIMKQLLLLLITLTLFGNVFGQKIELTASLNSGLFSFKGVDATKNTYLRVDNSTGQCQVMSSIGSEGGLCYGLSLNLKKIIKKKYFFGVDIGYEVLRSRANIIAIEESTPIFSGQSYDVTYHIATGSAYTNNSFINTHPFIGYR